MAAFEITPLEDLIAIGCVTERSVRIWARAPGAEQLAVEVTETTALDRAPAAVVSRRIDVDADHTVAFTVPDDAPGLSPLAPDRAYEVRVRRQDGRLVGEGRFRTAPRESPERFVFAVASCHQPFDDDGRLVPRSVSMLEHVPRALADHDARFLLQVGDQIYADYPPSRSLFDGFFKRVAPRGRETVLDCTREEVRRLYHERHRIFFAAPHFGALQTAMPCYPMLDDHEIRDNFGTAAEHASERWRALREGARDAFRDYQASRVLDGSPPSFHYGFVHGPVAVFMMDLRSERRADSLASVFSDGQLHDLERFMSEHAVLPVLAIVVTVPVAHVSATAARIGVSIAGGGTDIADRWTSPAALADRNRLLRAIRAHQKTHPAQRVVLLGGDIHVGCLFRIEWDDEVPPLHQFTSSALSNNAPAVAQWAAEQVPRVLHGVAKGEDLAAAISIVPSCDGEGRNPYGGLNVGVVEIEQRERTMLRFKLIGEERRVVYDSGLI